MARFSAPKQTRSILNQYGLYIVKTSDMITYHRTFEDAVESYAKVYCGAPIAGVLKPVVTQAQRFQEMRERSMKIIDKSNAAIAKGYQLAADLKTEVQRQRELTRKIRAELNIKHTDPWMMKYEREAA